MTTPAATSLSTQSVSRQRVSIQTVDPTAQTATALTRYQTSITIDTSYHVGAVHVTPSVGEQWFVKRLSNNWILDDKLPFNTEAVSNVIQTPVQGTNQIGSSGANAGPLNLLGSLVNLKAPLSLKSYATTAYPSATAAGSGSLIWDNILNQVVYSTGSAWASLASATGAYSLPSGGIPTTDLSSAVQSALTAASTAYQVPGGGIPSTSLTSALQSLISGAYQFPSGGIPASDLSAAVVAQLNAGGTIAPGSITMSDLSTTGTASSTTYLNGSGVWTTVGTADDLKTLMNGITGLPAALPGDVTTLWNNLLSTLANVGSGATLTQIQTRLQNLTTGGLFNAATLTNISNIVTGIPQNAISGLATALSNLLSITTWNSFLAQANTALGTAGSDLTHLIGGLTAIPQASITGLTTALGNLLSTGTWTSFLSQANTALATGGSDLTHLITGLGAVPQGNITGLLGRITNLNTTGSFIGLANILDGTGGNPLSGYLGNLSHLGVFTDITKIADTGGHALSSYLANMSNAGVFSGLGNITDGTNPLSGYLTNLSHLGVFSGLANIIDGSSNPLSGYVANISHLGVFSDITKIQDATGHALSAYLTNVTNTGVFQGLANILDGVGGNPLSGYVTHLTNAGVFQGLANILDGVGGNPLSGYVANISHTGVFTDFTKILDVGSNALSGYLAHHNTSGVIDAVTSITGLPGYLTHLNTSGVFSGLANILDGSSNPLSGYVTNLSSLGKFSGLTNILDGSSNPLSGYVANLSHLGVFSGLANIVDGGANPLSGYLSHVSLGGIVSSAGVPALQARNITPNLVLDPGFENSTLWTNASAGVQTTAQAHGGTNSWSLTGAGTGNTTILRLINDDTGPQSLHTRAGDNFNLQIFLFPKSGNAGGGTVSLQLNCSDSTGVNNSTIVTAVSETVPTTGSWSILSGIGVVPTGYDTVSPRVTLTSVPLTDIVYVDDALVREVTIAQSLLDTLANVLGGTSTTGHGLSTITSLFGAIPQANVSGLLTSLSSLLSNATWTSFLSQANTALSTAGSDLTHLITGLGAIPQTNVSGLPAKITNLNSSGIWTDLTKIQDTSNNALSGYLAHHNSSGQFLGLTNVLDASSNPLSGYVTNLNPTTGVFTDLTKIVDTGSHALSSYLGHLSTSGVIDAVSSITGLPGYLTNLSTGGVFKGLANILDASNNPLTGYVTNLSATTGVFTDFTKILDTGAHALSGYLAHHNTSGVIDAVSSVTGLPGYLTNLNTSGVFTDFTKILDTGSHALSGYLAHHSTAGLIDAVSSITGLPGYLTNLNTSGIMLPTGVGNVLGGGSLGADVTAILTQGISALGGSTSTLTDWNAYLQKIPPSNLNPKLIPSFDAVGTSAQGTGATLTGSHTGTNGAKVYAFVTAQGTTAPTVSSITLGGVAMTAVPSTTVGFANGNGANGYTSIYKGTANGSAQAVVTNLTGSGGNTVVVDTISYTGVASEVYAIPGAVGVFGSTTSISSGSVVLGTNQVAVVAMGTRFGNISAPAGGNEVVPPYGVSGQVGQTIRQAAATTTFTATASTSSGWGVTGIILSGNTVTAIDTSIIPDITQAMSSGIDGLVNQATYALDNTFGLTGNTPAGLAGLLGQLPTMLHNFGFGSSASSASVSSANAALDAMAGTIQSQGIAIASLRSQLSTSAGLAAGVTFQDPAQSVFNTVGGYTWAPPSWFTLGADIVDGTVVGSGAGGDGAGFGAGPGAAGGSVTMTLSGTGGGTITGTGGGVDGGYPGAAGVGAGTQTNDDVLYTGGAAQTVASVSGYPPGGGGAAGTGFNRYGGGAGTWGTATWKPAIGSSITGTVGAGGGGGAGAGGTGGAGATGQAWVLARKAIQSIWTAGATVRRVQIYQYNSATAQTDSQEASGIWESAPGGTGTGHLVFIRGNSTLDTLVYLLLSYVSGVTNYELGCYNAGTNHVFQTGTLANAIPFNEFSLESDTGRDYTVLVNGNPQFTYSDVGNLSAAPGSSYRVGGWGSSDTTVASGQSHGSLSQWAFSDAGTPIPTSTVTTSNTTTATSYGDPNQASPTVGPSVLFNVGASGIVSFDLYALLTITSSQTIFAGFVLSGANTVAATDVQALRLTAPVSGYAAGLGARFTLTGLNPGTTTAKMVFRVTAGTGTFANRMITVDPK